MKFILTQGDIFATNISYLNDSEEYVNGLRELKELFLNKRAWGEETEAYLKGETYERALREKPEIYSISFSKEADLLSQWYMYARESGVRLGMLFPQEKQSFVINKNIKKDMETKLRDVHYFTRTGMPSQAYKKEKRVINRLVKDYAVELGVEKDPGANGVRIWKEIAPYIKNYEFRQEKEARLIFNADVSRDADLIEYRSANGVLIPYLDVYLEEGWPIVEIMVGPGRNQERVYASICHFVDYCALKIPEIDQAESAKRFLEGMSFYQVEQVQIDEYCGEVEENVRDGAGIITYNSQIYDVLKGKGGREQEYLNRNYYSKCGIVVRKSNAPYVFS